MPPPSLFAPADQAALLARIRSLTPATPALWGRMNVAQMLAHLQIALASAVGETKRPRSLLGRVVGRLAKRSALGPKPFGKGLPTDKSFVVKDPREFQRERDGLTARLDALARGGPSAFTDHPHIFFGPLTPPEWDLLMWKHVDHHLRQFGA